MSKVPLRGLGWKQGAVGCWDVGQTGRGVRGRPREPRQEALCHGCDLALFRCGTQGQSAPDARLLEILQSL